ncbi:MAG: response regulator [Brevundimonas sp.]|nr:response regulator [Brevundimonas sp.]
MAKSRILVVDDDPMILELLVTRLELAGYQVVTARDGHEALKRIAAAQPHAMILDVNMPRLDGFGVLRHLKSTERGQSLPVMVLTARYQASDVQEAIRLGAKDFLAKPFTDNQLFLRVGRLLRSARPADDVAFI